MAISISIQKIYLLLLKLQYLKMNVKMIMPTLIIPRHVPHIVHLDNF